MHYHRTPSRLLLLLLLTQGSPSQNSRVLGGKVKGAPTWDVGMNEGRGMLHWRVDQHRSYTVGTGHLQNLIPGKEELEKQEAESAGYTPDRTRSTQPECLRAGT